MAHRIARLALLTLLVATVALAQTEPSEVTIAREEWTDSSRNRTLPVKIYRPTSTPEKWPVLFLSHGLGGTRESIGYPGAAWSEAGYLVIALQHPGSDDLVWRNKPPAEVLASLQGAISAQNYRLRCEDVTFAIDHLAGLAKTDERFKGKLDLDRIGLAGHSFGAQTVQGIVGQTFPDNRTLREPRVKAAIAFSPGLSQQADAARAFANVNVPIFHFTGTADQAPLIRDLTPDERRIPFDHINQSDQYLLIFKDGDHAVFNGVPQRRRLQQNGNISPEQYLAWHRFIIASSTLFWDAHLRSDEEAEALLKRFGDTLGEAGTFEYKSNP
jgi:predicted dienelactone hydrolase